MSDIAIRVERLSKQYTIDHLQQRHDTLRDMWADAFKRLYIKSSNGVNQDDMIWALRDVSFQVTHGEAIGVIGRNGAGKSTLLKILSQITEPTIGKAVISGRVGSLLEVGTGFHPELTGRENIYLNGAILGMTRREINHKFDEIVSFAEIEKFLETPVKRYSSGMYVRLAFAVAAYLETEILLVDEVLAVGDAIFQKKCLGKMAEISNAGRTVLFVSHNMGAIASLTQSCLYLKNGRVETFAKTEDAIKNYMEESLKQRGVNNNSDLNYYRRDSRGDTPVRITGIWVGQSDEDLPLLSMGQSISISIEVNAHKNIEGANITIIIKNSLGERITVIFSWDQNFYLTLQPGKHIVTAIIDYLSLSPGIYFVDIGINQTASTKAYDVIKDYPIVQIVNHGAVLQWLDRPWGQLHINNVEWQALQVVQGNDG